MDAEGGIVARWDTGPIRLHCVFRFEMEHLLARAGFEALTVYGDFYEGDLKSDSSDMVWVAAAGPLTQRFQEFPVGIHHPAEIVTPPDKQDTQPSGFACGQLSHPPFSASLNQGLKRQ